MGKEVNFNDSGERRVFFRRAYKYICKKQNCEVEFDDRLNSGTFSSIGIVKEEKNNEYIIKINDYIKTYFSLTETQVDGAGTIPSFSELDDLSKKEVSFLLDVRNKEFDEEEKYVELETGASKEEMREGAGNIIEILGYGKIDCGELKKDNDADIHMPDDNTYTITPFRFYEMPYLDGITRKSYPLKDALALGADIANALCCVHDEELFNVGCHGDIKLSNMLYVSREDKYDPCKYVLTDFNTIHRDLGKTRVTGGIGTPATMPPEMCGKGKSAPWYSYTVDHYSLAATIYCMLNGGRYPDPDGNTRRLSNNKKPFSYPGFAKNGVGNDGYVDPLAEASKKKVADMLKEEHGFGSSEAEAAVEVYLFIVKQLEYDKKDRAIHPEEGESAVECTRRVKNTYLGFLYELGNACLEDKNYDRAAEYFGRYISRQERELRYILSDEKRENDSDLIAGHRKDLLDARCDMCLSFIRSKTLKDSEKILALKDFYLENGVVNQDRLYSVFRTLQENEDEEMMRDIFEELSSLWEGEELPPWVGGFINTVTYTVKYETEEAGRQPKERTYTTYSLHGQECIQETDLLLAEEASVCRVGYKVDEEHSDYPKTGEAVSDDARYIIRFIKDQGQTRTVYFTVVYKCEGQEVFSVKRKRELWSGDELRYSSDLAELPEEYTGKYSVKHVNMDEASVISDGSSILAECERIYVDTECVIKHVCDGIELAKDTFRSRCWAGDDERTVVLTGKALEPNEYRGYRFEKTEPERLSAGDKVKDGAEIRLVYRKAMDDVKTVFYAVTYYKDGKECDSTIQRQQIWAGADDKLRVSGETFADDRYEEYELDHVEPDVREGGEIQSGSLLNVYYAKKQSDAEADRFVISDATLVKYNGDEKRVDISYGIEIIGTGAFLSCSKLESVKFPKELKIIDNSAFMKCSSIKTIELPEGLRKIGFGAFYGCSSLESIKLPETLEDIGAKAFGNCTALKGKIYLPKAAKYVAKDAFEGCDALEVLGKDDSAEQIADRLKSCSKSDKPDDKKSEVLPVLRDPRIIKDASMESGQKVTWDCIWFGSYPQSEVVCEKDFKRIKELEGGKYESQYIAVSSTLWNKITSAAYDENGDAVVDGVKYRRLSRKDATFVRSGTGISNYYEWGNDTVRYFKYEPIKWRVLNVNGNDALLLADKALDDQRYNELNKDVRWESCTRRSWLNGYDSSLNSDHRGYTKHNFINVAFKSDEIGNIKTTNDTSDKIFLLSKNEIYDSNTAAAYGFVRDRNTYDEARRCKSSTFAKAMGSYSNIGGSNCCWWWLRSPGYYADLAAHVDTSGLVINYGNNVDNDSYAVRPALHLDLSASGIYRYAGAVCSDGSENNSQAPSRNNRQENELKIKANDERGKKSESLPEKKPQEKLTAEKKYSFKIAGATLEKYHGNDSHVVIPEGVEFIANNAFIGCKAITSIQFPKSLKYIGYEAFADCASLRELKFPEGLEEIGRYAFSGCKGVTSVELNEGLKYIRDGAFRGCSALKGKVYIPASVIKLEENAFTGNGGVELIYATGKYIVDHIMLDETGKESSFSRIEYTNDASLSERKKYYVRVMERSLIPKEIPGYKYFRMDSANGRIYAGKLVPSETVIKLYYKKNTSDNDSHENLESSWGDVNDFFAQFDEPVSKKTEAIVKRKADGRAYVKASKNRAVTKMPKSNKTEDPANKSKRSKRFEKLKNSILNIFAPTQSMRLDNLKRYDVVTFADDDKVVVLARCDYKNRKFVYVNEILPDESDVTDVYKVMEIHLEDGTLEKVVEPELLQNLLPIFLEQLEKAED